MPKPEFNNFETPGPFGGEIHRDEFVWPDREAAEGSAAAVALTLVELLSIGRFRMLNLPQIQQLGIYVEASLDRRGVIRINAPKHVDFVDRGLAEAKHVQIDPTDRGIVGMDLNDAVARIELADGRAIECVFNGEKVELVTSAGPASLAQIQPPDLTSWCEQVGDGWLRDYLSAYVLRRDPWHCAIAVELFGRLREFTGAEARVVVTDLLAGKREPFDQQVAAWRASLTESQLAALSKLFIAEVDSLVGALEDLGPLVDEGSELWRRVLARIVTRRDDLEALRRLLRATLLEASEELNEVVEYLDVIGIRTVGSLPEHPEINDERLIRACNVDPMAWWLRVVAT